MSLVSSSCRVTLNLLERTYLKTSNPNKTPSIDVNKIKNQRNVFLISRNEFENLLVSGLISIHVENSLSIKII